eukprot:2579268-Pyramimonas_sp.AAC.1
MSTRFHRAGLNRCVQLALPFYATDEKLAEVQDQSAGWARQPHGTPVTALHSNITRLECFLPLALTILRLTSVLCCIGNLWRWRLDYCR